MTLEITKHANARMRRYGVTKHVIISVIDTPDAVVQGYTGRRIYQKKLNEHVLRVIVEEHKNIRRVITVYKARSVRYEI